MPAAVLVPSLISAATSIGSSLISANAAKSAAKTQAGSAEQAAALQTPAMTIGNGAIAKLAGMYGLPTGQSPMAPADMLSQQTIPSVVGKVAQFLRTPTSPLMPANGLPSVANPNPPPANTSSFQSPMRPAGA